MNYFRPLPLFELIVAFICHIYKTMQDLNAMSTLKHQFMFSVKLLLKSLLQNQPTKLNQTQRNRQYKIMLIRILMQFMPNKKDVVLFARQHAEWNKSERYKFQN